MCSPLFVRSANPGCMSGIKCGAVISVSPRQWGTRCSATLWSWGGRAHAWRTCRNRRSGATPVDWHHNWAPEASLMWAWRSSCSDERPTASDACRWGGAMRKEQLVGISPPWPPCYWMSLSPCLTQGVKWKGITWQKPTVYAMLKWVTKGEIIICFYLFIYLKRIKVYFY